ncbi:MAG: transglycosylase SLT domain-containing protein [Parvibaculaceae bacterium]
MSKKAVIMAMALMLGLSGDARAEVAKELKAAIAGYAAMYGLPASLVHRVVKRESRYNPRAYHRGHYGLMQIRYDTARTMGYRGKPKGLLDVDANLRYGVKYLAGAYLVSGGNADRAVRYYRSGYYYAAKRKGLLEETGLRTRR